jgi:hypothetical protein
MQVFWIVVAAAAAIVAAVFLWHRDFDTAFVVAAVGAVSWFLNYRVQMRRPEAAVKEERALPSENENEE